MGEKCWSCPLKIKTKKIRLNQDYSEIKFCLCSTWKRSILLIKILVIGDLERRKCYICVYAKLKQFFFFKMCNWVTIVTQVPVDLFYNYWEGTSNWMGHHKQLLLMRCKLLTFNTPSSYCETNLERRTRVQSLARGEIWHLI